MFLSDHQHLTNFLDSTILSYTIHGDTVHILRAFSMGHLDMATVFCLVLEQVAVCIYHDTHVHIGDERETSGNCP
jgi:hypothetical protein